MSHDNMDDMAEFATENATMLKTYDRPRTAPQGREEQGWTAPAEACTEFLEDQTDSADGEVFPYLALMLGVVIALAGFAFKMF
jgi:hypothetical protein